MLDSLDASVVRQDSNATLNRKLWDTYAGSWDPGAAWVKRMGRGSGRDGPAC